MSEPRLEHQNVKVKQLIDDYRSGRIVIPEFQREYVWKKSRAPLLIDSLYRGFPVSSLLLWQSHRVELSRRQLSTRLAERKRFRRLFDAREGDGLMTSEVTAIRAT
jgi:uncharacterized protein with ParB-like and HNH nuclease domain